MVYKKRAVVVVRKRPMYKKRPGRNLKGLVKSMMLKQVETKKQQWSPADYNLPADSMVVCNCLYQNVLGAGKGNHIGDELSLKGFNMKLSLRSSSISEIRGRLVLVRSRQRIADVGTQDWNSTTATNFVTTASGSNASSLWQFDSDQCTVLATKNFVIRPFAVYNSVLNSTSGLAKETDVKSYKSMKNMKFQYESGDTGYGKFHNYYWILFATNYTGNITVKAHAVSYYKDP